jgi:hypothetical protein
MLDARFSILVSRFPMLDARFSIFPASGRVCKRFFPWGTPYGVAHAVYVSVCKNIVHSACATSCTPYDYDSMPDSRFSMPDSRFSMLDARYSRRVSSIKYRVSRDSKSRSKKKRVISKTKSKQRHQKNHHHGASVLHTVYSLRIRIRIRVFSLFFFATFFLSLFNFAQNCFPPKSDLRRFLCPSRIDSHR